MKLLITIPLAAILFLSVLSAQAQQIKVSNTVEDFKILVGRLKDANPQQQDQAWQKFESKYAAVYEQILPGRESESARMQTDNKIAYFLQNLRFLETDIFKYYQLIPNFVAVQGARFKHQFPDMKDGMRVIFLPTLGINGAQRTVASMGGSILVIGVDRLAETHESLDVLFSHEFFHSYHTNKIEHLKIWDSMASPLWTEGLATYVSSLMAPDTDDTQRLMSAELAQACTDDNVKIWSREYLLVIDQLPEGKNYADWFRVSTDQPIKRRGYCLGYRSASLLAKTTSLMEMASWGEDQFSVKLKIALAKLLQ